MPPSPLVSILLPTYNREMLLREALPSALSQSLSDVEIIVVVDGSTDGTIQYLKSINRPNLVLIYQENRGLCASLNRAMSAAKGAFLQILNDDDRLPRNSSEILSGFLTTHPDFGAVFGGNIIIDGQGREQYRIPVVNPEKHLACMGKQWMWSKPMIRSGVARQVGGFKKEYDRVEDIDYYLRLRACSKVAMVSEYVYEYRWHAAGSMLDRSHTFVLPAMKMYMEHIDKGTVSRKEQNPKAVLRRSLWLACFYKHPEIADEVIAFSKARNESLAGGLIFSKRLLLSAPGWLFLRIWLAGKGFARRLENLLWLLEYNLRRRVTQ